MSGVSSLLREHEAFAAATTAHEPSFMERGSRRRGAAGEPPIGRELIVRHGQPEQRGQEDAPRSPCASAKEATEHVGDGAWFQGARDHR
jgi:hypothetical protein